MQLVKSTISCLTGGVHWRGNDHGSGQHQPSSMMEEEDEVCPLLAQLMCSPRGTRLMVMLAEFGARLLFQMLIANGLSLRANANITTSF